MTPEDHYIIAQHVVHKVVRQAKEHYDEFSGMCGGLVQAIIDGGRAVSFYYGYMVLPIAVLSCLQKYPDLVIPSPTQHQTLEALSQDVMNLGTAMRDKIRSIQPDLDLPPPVFEKVENAEDPSKGLITALFNGVHDYLVVQTAAAESAVETGDLNRLAFASSVLDECNVFIGFLLLIDGMRDTLSLSPPQGDVLGTHMDENAFNAGDLDLSQSMDAVHAAALYAGLGVCGPILDHFKRYNDLGVTVDNKGSLDDYHAQAKEGADYLRDVILASKAPVPLLARMVMPDKGLIHAPARSFVCECVKGLQQHLQNQEVGIARIVNDRGLKSIYGVLVYIQAVTLTAQMLKLFEKETTILQDAGFTPIQYEAHITGATDMVMTLIGPR